eukprot:2975108-Amphidinium_carterae.1
MQILWVGLLQLVDCFWGTCRGGIILRCLDLYGSKGFCFYGFPQGTQRRVLNGLARLNQGSQWSNGLQGIDGAGGKGRDNYRRARHAHHVDIRERVCDVWFTSKQQRTPVDKL